MCHPDAKSRGQVAYERHRAATDGSGEWRDLSDAERQAWKTIAEREPQKTECNCAQCRLFRALRGLPTKSNVTYPISPLVWSLVIVAWYRQSGASPDIDRALKDWVDATRSALSAEIVALVDEVLREIPRQGVAGPSAPSLAAMVAEIFGGGRPAVGKVS